jgi:hypothetical protein
MALHSQFPQWVEVWSKSGTNEGQFTLVAETVLRRSIASHFSWVTQASRVGIPPHAPKPLRIWSKSGSNGHFPLEVERVFPPYLASHCRRWLKHHTWHCLLMCHKQWKFGRNRVVTKCTLVLRPRQFLAPISPSHCGVVAQTSHMVLNTHAAQPV